VCVISLEDVAISPENIPYSQCREVRTIAAQTSNMDKITIAASAAICGTIIIAVIIFIAASRYVCLLSLWPIIVGKIIHGNVFSLFLSHYGLA
jgi:ABC-type siderophore export system fused ATPase/permease subunit